MKLLSGMKISQKLFTGLLIIVLGFITFSVFIFNALTLVKVNGPIYRQLAEGKDLVADVLPPPEYIIESYLTAFELRENMNSEEEAQRLAAYVQELKKGYDVRHEYWVKDTIVLSLNKTLRDAMIDRSSRPVTDFYRILEADYLPAIRAKNKNLADSILQYKLKPCYTEHRRHINTVVDLSMAQNAEIEKQAAAIIRNKSFQSMAICIISLFAGLAAFICILLQITKALKKLTYNIKDISEGDGDLTRRLTVEYNDEIGEASTYCNRFIEKLQQILCSVIKTAETVSSSSSELSSIATRIAANTEEMSTQTASVASSTTQATASIGDISIATEEMSCAANTVATSIEEMSASLNEVAKSCQKELRIAAEANDHARGSKEIMNQLGGAAKSIGNVVEVINDIAEQTNLLALNATIEAASAGEAGKGFAVVAKEVKELAKQTAQATQEIQKQVETMQANTESAVRAIELVSKVIEDVNSISQTIVSAVEEQSSTVNEISKNVTGVSAGVQKVSRKVSESATGLSEVTTTITEVSGAVTDSARGITGVRKSAQDLASLSLNLKTLLSQFKT